MEHDRRENNIVINDRIILRKDTFVDDNNKINNLLRKLYGISINNIKEINCGYDREIVIDQALKKILQSN